MRVLQVNKFFWEFGGPERCMFETARLLEDRGHPVAFFSMAHPRNRRSPWERFFVSRVEFGGVGARTRLASLPRAIGGTYWSFQARRRLSRLLREFRPDVAHVHSIYHHISPSILPLLRRAGVPVVQTCHDYQLVCPAYHLYIHHAGTICERCLGGAFRHAVVHRCLKNSVAVSALAASAARIHRSSGVIKNHVDLWIAPSRFLGGKLVEGGFPADRVRYLHNVLDLRGFEPGFSPGDDVVYVGRLSPEKGIGTLVQAVGRVAGLALTIVGEGEERGRLERMAEDVAPGRVRFAGYRSGEALHATIRGAACLVLPSEWYENCPMVVLEAYALGTPVIAASIGGIPESVVDGRTGWLFPAGDAAALADRLERMRDDPARRETMGREGLRHVAALCAGHLDALLDLYREAGERMRAAAR